MIYLLHIPKTGGQSLALRLGAGFARRSVLRQDVGDAATLARLAAECDFFEGHPGEAVLRDAPAGLRVMAAVRDPFAHAVSHYRHIRRDPAHPLNAPAHALAPAAFLDRFSHHMANFQARSLVTAYRFPMPADRVQGLEGWLLRHLPEALEGLSWAVPSESIDEFCALWPLETGRHAQGDPGLRVNQASEGDGTDPAALRRWCVAHADRFAVDLALWGAARQRYAAWRHALMTRDAAGAPTPGLAAWQDGEAGVWLTRDWHPPAERTDGVTEWWAGPGLFPRLRLRRGGRRRLRFEALTLLGVRWDRMRLLRQADLSELPVRRVPDQASGIVAFEAELDALGPDEELALYAPEDVTVLPAVPLAWENPRRGFATQAWRLE